VTLTPEIVTSTPALKDDNRIGNLNADQMFKEPDLTIQTNPGFSMITSKFSHDKKKIAYAEISNCIFNEGDCSFDFNLYIQDVGTQKKVLVYTHKHTKNDADFMVYFPILWSKNDLKLVLQYGNPTDIGMGGGPEWNWALLDGSTKKIEDLSPSYPEFIDDNLYAIFTDSSPKSPELCGPVNGNSGKIVKKNIETGASVTLLEQPNFTYSNLSVVGTTLNYERAPNFITDDAYKCGEVDWSKQFEKGSVPI